MATVALSAKAIGDIVKIKVNGTLRDFIVVHKGKPSSMYDNSFDNGVILLMKDIYETRQWHNSNVHDYANSDIHSYLNNTFLNLIESDIRSKIVQVKVPYRAGSGTSATITSGANGLPAKVFLLSGYEVGFDSAISPFFPPDGALLSYFQYGNSGGTRAPRIAYYNGIANVWWLRSPFLRDSGHTLYVGTAGDYSFAGSVVTYGVRPALVLPSSIFVSDNGTIVTNTPPPVPASITIPTTIKGGEQFTITWGASTDADGNLSGYKLERSLNGGAWSQVFQANARTTTDTVAFGTNTVAYRVKAYDAVGAESTYQTSPTRTVVNNVPPTKPSNLTVPANVAGGASITVSWGASTSTTSTIASYILERSVDGGAYAQVYKGTNLFYADSITKGWKSVAYQVKAVDAIGDSSGYAQSPTRTVDNTSPPAISSTTSGNMGVKAAGFTWQYTVTHVDNSATQVTETMDGVTVRTYTATLGQAGTFSVTGAYFQSLLNGAHTMKVTATADGKSASHTVTFTKGVYALSITLDTPLPAAEPITKMVMTIIRNIPADAMFQVLVTNNANDPSPVWEDITTAVINGINHLFTNTTFVNAPALNFRITASRGPSNIGGSISSIGGAFE